MSPDRFAVLLTTDKAAVVPVVEDALRAAGIPCHTGVQVAPAPLVVFSVPEDRIDEARQRVAQFFGEGPLAAPSDEDTEAGEAEPARFPWRPVLAVSSLLVVHLAVLAIARSEGTASELGRALGVPGGLELLQPWRLVTYLFVHADFRHAFWNGLSTLVFTVPLAEAVGLRRTGLAYLACGVLGGFAASAAAPAGTFTIGSSGAVAGLFGAWLALKVRSARRAPLGRRGVIRAVGIGLLVLPTLLSPTTADGHRTSVGGHVGGLAAGIVLGLLLDRGRHRSRGGAASGDEGLARDPVRGRFRDAPRRDR